MRILLTTFLIFIVTLTCQADEMMVKSALNVVSKNWSKPNSSNQEDLRLNMTRMVPGAFHLGVGTKINIVRSHDYDMRITRPVRSSMKEEKWDYQAAYIEVLEGPNQGKKGWAVVKRKRHDSKSWQTYIGAPSQTNSQGRSGSSASQGSPKGDPNAPDLQVRASRGSKAVAGKVIYSVNYINMGKSETKSKVVIQVEVDGKIVKTHRHSGRLKPGRGGYFDFEVSDSHARQRKPYVVTIDPDENIEEFNEANNVYKGRL